MSVATGGAATGMPGLPEVWQWEEQLVGFGTRYTGSSAPPVFSLNLAQTPTGGYVPGQSSD